jgi:hypothetical protein
MRISVGWKCNECLSMFCRPIKSSCKSNGNKHKPTQFVALLCVAYVQPYRSGFIRSLFRTSMPQGNGIGKRTSRFSLKLNRLFTYYSTTGSHAHIAWEDYGIHFIARIYSL